MTRDHLRLTTTLGTALFAFSVFAAEVAPRQAAEPVPAPAAEAADKTDAQAKAPAATIQIALLLDTSSSMNGLINQARAHLWSVVNQFASTRYDGRMPNLEVALMEYGNSGLPGEEGFMRVVVPFTTDLDKVSEELFALRTNGGQEYCGQAIHVAMKELLWTKSNRDYKAIFIAGNEPFTQGPVDYREACKEAIAAGVIVNTIHCGNESAGVSGMWQDGATIADGSFMTIDQQRAVVHIKAPQDEELSQLNAQLNATYVTYGKDGAVAAERQSAQDAAVAGVSGAAQLDRVASKASANYRNDHWDLVDAVEAEKVDLAELKDEELPEAMRGMDAKERAEYVQKQAEERAAVQAKIRALSAERNLHIEAERKKLAAEAGEADLGEAMLGAVREQLRAKQYEFVEE